MVDISEAVRIARAHLPDDKTKWYATDRILSNLCDAIERERANDMATMGLYWSAKAVTLAVSHDTRARAMQTLEQLVSEFEELNERRIQGST